MEAKVLNKDSSPLYIDPHRVIVFVKPVLNPIANKQILIN